MKNIQNIVDKYYNLLLEDLFKLTDEDLYEILIEIKLSASGTTVRRSWLDREKMLTEQTEQTKSTYYHNPLDEEDL